MRNPEIELFNLGPYNSYSQCHDARGFQDFGLQQLRETLICALTTGACDGDSAAMLGFWVLVVGV